MWILAKIAYTWEKMALPIETRRRTLTELHLANGSIVRCVPAGQDGEQARGYGVRNGLLIYDEAAFIPDAVYGSTLAIAEDNCKTILITTPGGKSGKAYDMWTDRETYPEVERIRACSLDVPRMAKLVKPSARRCPSSNLMSSMGCLGSLGSFSVAGIVRGVRQVPVCQHFLDESTPHTYFPSGRAMSERRACEVIGLFRSSMQYRTIETIETPCGWPRSASRRAMVAKATAR